MNSESTIAETTESSRTEYRDGGVLSAAALAEDAAANAAAWETHQRQGHLRGIVSGLHVTVEESTIRIEKNDEAGNKTEKMETVRLVNVSPGAAIDSDGRMLLVDHDLTRHISKEDGKCFAVWLRLVVETVATPESDLQRYRETSRLEVSAIDDLQHESPNTTPSGVLLAYLRQDRMNAGLPEVDRSCRRYVGAVGNRIESPSGRARVVLGPQFPRDPRRFAIGVQSEPDQPIRDVFTWESTGTIRLGTRTSVASPHVTEQTDKIEQPPITIVGASTVCFTREDILDPCRVWTRLIIKGEDGKDVIQPEIVETVSDGDRIALATRPACLAALQSLVLRSLNRLIRRAADDVRDLVTRRKFEPGAKTFVVDEIGNEFIVENVYAATKTFDIIGANEERRDGVSWQTFWPRDWSPAVFLTDGNLPEELLKMLSRWRVLPGDYMCRVLLDHFLGDAVKPLESPAPRGIYFNGTVPVKMEPQASRIHLVEFKKDGQTFRQLRITIRDPGKENNPHRYRCSIGTALDCTHQPAPTPTEKSWNRQTSWPRGILSVLADKSVDIHDQLNVYPAEGSILPGLILKLEPDSDSGAGASGRAAGGSPIPATQILGNAVVWEGQRVQRKISSEIIINGSLQNLTDLAVESLQILASIYGKGDTDHPPTHKAIVSQNTLAAKSTVPVKTLAFPGSLILEILPAFHAKLVVVSLLVMGVNSQNSIICTQYTEELTVPPAPPAS